MLPERWFVVVMKNELHLPLFLPFDFDGSVVGIPCAPKQNKVTNNTSFTVNFMLLTSINKYQDEFFFNDRWWLFNIFFLSNCVFSCVVSFSFSLFHVVSAFVLNICCNCISLQVIYYYTEHSKNFKKKRCRIHTIKYICMYLSLNLWQNYV